MDIIDSMRIFNGQELLKGIIIDQRTWKTPVSAMGDVNYPQGKG